MKHLHPQLFAAISMNDEATVGDALTAVRRAKWWLDVLRTKPNATIHVKWASNLEDVPDTMKMGEYRRRLNFLTVAVKENADDIE